MLVFREQTERCRTGSLIQALTCLLAQVGAARRHDDAIELLIAAGQLESAVLDAEQPEADRPSVARAALDAVTRAAGRVAACSWKGEKLELPVGDVAVALRWLRELPLPGEVEVKTPEGYAWYAVHPEAWFEAARRLSLGEAPTVVMGLRSIGTSLSAMVAAAFPPARIVRFSVRPRGHPFGRRPRLDPSLLECLHQRGDETFVIVDEGPGMSGSSLVGVADTIASLGIDDGRIVLLPAWNPCASRLGSAHARENWDRWRKVVVSPESIGLLADVLPAGDEVQEWSAGAWRTALLPPDAWPPVQPQHERRKWRTRGEIIRFVGLGRPGRAVTERIARMHDRGFGPALKRVKHGYATLRYVEGQLAAARDAGFASTLARYLQWISTERLEQRIDFDALVELIEVNLREVLGRAAPSLASYRRAIEDGTPVRIDGRLHPHEWVRTAERWIKLDGFDHHADHFYPGGQDLAWDLAGVAAEHGLELREEVLRRLEGNGIERTPSPAARIHFYDVAYGACRAGYAQVAAEATQDDESARWRKERDRYVGFLEGALARLLAPRHWK